MFVAELRWDTVFFSTDCHFSSLVWVYIFSFVPSYFSLFTTLQTRLCMCGPIKSTLRLWIWKPQRFSEGACSMKLAAMLAQVHLVWSHHQ